MQTGEGFLDGLICRGETAVYQPWFPPYAFGAHSGRTEYSLRGGKVSAGWEVEPCCLLSW